MRGLAAGLVVLAGCSAGTATTTTTLVPLPTNPPVVGTIPGEDVSYTPAQFAFFDDAVYYFDGPLPMDDATAIGYAETWCRLMEEGMQDTDVVERINEGASDNADRRAHFSIVLAGISDLCPLQGAKAEYIALNMPLP